MKANVMQSISYSFTSVLQKVRINNINTAVFLPSWVILQLPRGKWRVKGLLNGVPFSVSILHKRDGNRFFSINESLSYAARVKHGDQVFVTFNLIDPKVVEYPNPYETKPDGDDDALRTWKKLKTSGKILSAYIALARNIDCRVRHSVDSIQRGKIITDAVPQLKKNKRKL